MPKMPDEYDAFKLLTEGLAQCSDAALILAKWRPDQARQWEKMAEVYRVSREACFHLAGEGVRHSKQ